MVTPPPTLGKPGAGAARTAAAGGRSAAATPAVVAGVILVGVAQAKEPDQPGR